MIDFAQLTNYSLQKQIREYESHEKVQATEREQHIRQMSQFETQFRQVTNVTKEVTGKQMKLEKDSKIFIVGCIVVLIAPCVKGLEELSPSGHLVPK